MIKTNGLREYYNGLEDYITPKKDLIDKIAKACNVSIPTVRNWIYGKHTPSNSAHIKVVSEITGVSEKDLFK